MLAGKISMLKYFSNFFKHKNDVVFEGKRRLKTCHWVLIGAMGPEGIDSSVPPSLLRRSDVRSVSF
jgi:hypothetical protein